MDLQSVLNSYFEGDDPYHFNTLVGLIYDLSTIGVLIDANEVVDSLDNVWSEDERTKEWEGRICQEL